MEKKNPRGIDRIGGRAVALFVECSATVARCFSLSSVATCKLQLTFRLLSSRLVSSAVYYTGLLPPHSQKIHLIVYLVIYSLIRFKFRVNRIRANIIYIIFVILETLDHIIGRNWGFVPHTFFKVFFLLLRLFFWLCAMDKGRRCDTFPLSKKINLYHFKKHHFNLYNWNDGIINLCRYLTLRHIF